MPPPNGSPFDNYVAEALRALMAFHEAQMRREQEAAKKAEARKRWVQVNLLALCAVVLAMVLFYAKVIAHLDDASVHPMRVEREAEFDQRFDLKMEGRDEQQRAALANQEKMQRSLDRIEEQVSGFREAVNIRNRRDESFNHTGRP